MGRKSQNNRRHNFFIFMPLSFTLTFDIVKYEEAKDFNLEIFALVQPSDPSQPRFSDIFV